MKAETTPRKPVRDKRTVPKKLPIEYILLITPRFDERTERTFFYVAVRTVQEFTSFRYELVVDHRVEERTMIFDIQGLRAPRVTLPGFGPATFESKHEKLSGPYDVVVNKLQKERNKFRIHITSKEVSLESKPDEPFIEIVTHMEDW